MFRTRSGEISRGRVFAGVALAAASLLLTSSCKSDATALPSRSPAPAVCPSPDRYFMDGREVPLTGSYADALKLVMMTPADGVIRIDDIQWDGATLAAKRDVLVGMLSNSVEVQEQNGGSRSFGVEDIDKDGVLEVTTVSGGPGVELSPVLSQTLARELEKSLPMGCIPGQVYGAHTPTAPATLV